MALLVDPDKTDTAHGVEALAEAAEAAGVGFLFVGGSLIQHPSLDLLVRQLRGACSLPVVLFPGHPTHLTPEAHAVLLLSLISGRNPELLIGQHVVAAPLLHRMQLEVLPTGYLLVDGGRPTSAQYVSGTLPLPHDKPDLAACTALAGQYLGLQLMYADTGSGALQSLRPDMVQAMREVLSVPLIVGGGIRKPEQAEALLAAGADIFVVGTAMEGPAADAGLLHELAATTRSKVRPTLAQSGT